jgi:hypothetical protein
MTRTEFAAVLADCAVVTETYLREAEKTSGMLVQCTGEPLPFDQRFALLSQEILEMEAFRSYLGAKRRLHNAALVGYEELSTD